MAIRLAESAGDPGALRVFAAATNDELIVFADYCRPGRRAGTPIVEGLPIFRGGRKDAVTQKENDGSCDDYGQNGLHRRISRLLKTGGQGMSRMCVAAGIWLVVNNKSVPQETGEELKDALSVLRKRG
jgi:hypothetical protein